MIFLISSREGKDATSNRWKQQGFVVADNITMAANKLGFNMKPEMVTEQPGHLGALFYHPSTNTNYDIEAIREITEPMV
jgi:hypothetical protein